MVINSPYGRVMALGFMWSSDDHDTAKIWLAKFEALGTVLMNTVAATLIHDWLNASSAFVPKGVYGSSRTHNLREMGSEASAIIGSALEKMPSDPAAMLSVHQLRGSSAKETSNSVFGTRDPHFMLEILGYASTKEDRSKNVEWAVETWEAIGQIGNDIVLPGAYISLEPPGLNADQAPLSRIYGTNDGEVLALKRKFDPTNTFDLAVPRLKGYM
jgi:hypothetical protein